MFEDKNKYSNKDQDKDSIELKIGGYIVVKFRIALDRVT